MDPSPPPGAGWGAPPVAPSGTPPAWGAPPAVEPASWTPSNTPTLDGVVASRRPTFPVTGLIAALAFILAATGVLMPWVSGVAPDADGTVGDVLDVVGFEPGEPVTYKGLDIPGLGAAAAATALVGAGLAIAGVVLRRPVIFLSTSGAAGAVAALAGIAVVLLVWLEIDNVPFSSYIPEDVRSQIPDPDVERGLWVFLVGAAVGSILCSVAAVSTHRGRYGPRQTF